MIRNYEEVKRLEREYSRRHPLSMAQKFAILNGLYQEAKRFGHFTAETAKEGLGHDIEIARILNVHLRNAPGSSGTGS